jgi:chemotaxis methyl-accepting protein methylase
MTMSVLQDICWARGTEFRQISDSSNEHCGINLHDGQERAGSVSGWPAAPPGSVTPFSQYISTCWKTRRDKEFSILVDSLSTNLTKFFREEAALRVHARRSCSAL